ncbi:hypothetical protein FRC12_019372, partial [Ceratobasidium sp. 428]
MSSNSKNTTSERDTRPPLHEKKVGIWTMYFASTPQPSTPKDSTSISGSTGGLDSLQRTIPIKLVRRFILDAISIGPTMFILYFGCSAVSNLVPVLQLGNNARVLDLIQTALLRNQPTPRKDFILTFASYLLLVVCGWTARKVKNYTEPVLQQRLVLHFKKRILAVQTQLDMVTANNPAMSAKVQNAITFSDRSWGAVEAIATVLSITAGAVGQASVLSRVFGLHWDVP